jgi:predicted DNA-binding transcriptional regulator AlpA
MAVEENLNKSMYKLLILMLKYIPMLISLVYVLNTALSYFYIDIPVLSNLAGMSILPWIFMYLSATVFRFYLYHKMFLHYILVTDIINIIDYYVGIPIEDLELLMIHGTIEIVDSLKRFTDKEKRLSKYAACEYLNVSRATFDNYVREGKLPRGKHEIGFKELSWSKKELDEFVKKCRINQRLRSNPKSEIA